MNLTVEVKGNDEKWMKTDSSRSEIPRFRNSGPIRNRYLSRLGISSSSEPSQPTNTPPKLQIVLLRPCSTAVEVLKGDYNRPDPNQQHGSDLSNGSEVICFPGSDGGGGGGGSRSPQKGDSSRKKDSRKRVSFHSQVRVQWIPKRTEYSRRVSNALWTPPSELMYNAKRNTIEFRSENWDWRQVREDFVDLGKHHKQVHPIHLLRIRNSPCSMQHQFVQVLCAMQSANAC